MAKREQDIDDFTTPKRIYSDSELQDFHNKIQKFWDAPREVELEGGMSGTAKKFRHQDLHVAFGAARKVQQGNKSRYLYDSERFNQFNNLWDQYEDYMKKQDWIENKRVEELEKVATEVSF